MSLLSTHRFVVDIPGIGSAGFSDVSGLEMKIDYLTVIIVGAGAIHLAQPVASTPLTLRRGATASGSLWKAFSSSFGSGSSFRYLSGSIVQRSVDGKESVRWTFVDGLVTSFRSADLNAKEGGIAIEELQIVHRGLTRG